MDAAFLSAFSVVTLSNTAFTLSSILAWPSPGDKRRMTLAMRVDSALVVKACFAGFTLNDAFADTLRRATANSTGRRVGPLGHKKKKKIARCRATVAAYVSPQHLPTAFRHLRVATKSRFAIIPCHNAQPRRFSLSVSFALPAAPLFSRAATTYRRHYRASTPACFPRLL